MTSRTLLFIGTIGAVLLIAIVGRVTKLSFCGNTYPIPDECNAKSKHHLDCDDCELSWSYVEGNMLNYTAEQAAHNLEQKNYMSKRETISCFLQDKEVKAFKIIKRVEGKIRECQIIAYGIVNEQPVLVHLSLPHNLLTNENIPEGARQIIRLTK